MRGAQGRTRVTGSLQQGGPRTSDSQPSHLPGPLGVAQHNAVVQTGVRSHDDAKRRSEGMEGDITERDDTRTSSAWVRSGSLG